MAILSLLMEFRKRPHNGRYLHPFVLLTFVVFDKIRQSGGVRVHPHQTTAHPHAVHALSPSHSPLKVSDKHDWQIVLGGGKRSFLEKEVVDGCCP